MSHSLGLSLVCFSGRLRKSLLMQEIKVEIEPLSEQDSKLADKVKEHEMKHEEAKLAQTKVLLKSMESFLLACCDCEHFGDWKNNGSLTQLREDFNRLALLATSLDLDNDAGLTDELIEKMKSSRSSLLSSKKGVFYEALTLFPLGTFMQSRAGEAIQLYHHDKGLVQEIDQLVSACGACKPFTADTLVKKGNGDKDLEIQIPGMAKIGEIVSKYLSFAFSIAV